MSTTAFERALSADYAGQPFARFACCADCGAFGYCRGSRYRVVRCFPCHTNTRAARTRARRRSAK